MMVRSHDSNYMFRPVAAIIRFSSESMVVVLYRISVVIEISSSWHKHTNPIKHYHHTFG